MICLKINGRKFEIDPLVELNGYEASWRMIYLMMLL